MTAVARIARDRGVPVIAFSTDRTVAGNGVYLLSFQPENEVKRIVSYAARRATRISPRWCRATPMAITSRAAFREAVTAGGRTVGGVEHFSPDAGTVMTRPAAMAEDRPDAVLIAQGGTTAQAIAPTLAMNGIDRARCNCSAPACGTIRPSRKEPALKGGWFAAPAPDADDVFKRRNTRRLSARAAAAGDTRL